MTENKEQNDSGNNISDAENEQLPKNNWFVVLYYLYIHVFGIFGLYGLLYSAKWITILYFLFLIMCSYIGLTIGAHRFYAHQTFSASAQLRFFFVLTHTMAGVGSIYDWVFWHRLHHKYHDTDSDPYDHRKGFLYSHVLSNLIPAPSDLKSCYNNIDMRDVDSDRFVWLQQKFYWILFIVLGFVLPVIVVDYWEKSLVVTLLGIGVTRLMITTHIAWLVNSSLLIWGLRKEDRYPANDNTVFFISKTYWPNYHYMIPWDWKNDEFGSYEKGFSTFMIKMYYEMGLIDQMKTSTTEDVRSALEDISMSKVTTKEAIEQLKEKSEQDALKEKLIFRP